MSTALRLPFDQYQRYRLVADVMDRLRGGRAGKARSLRVLDVGGRTGLLRQFLKHDDVFLVDVEPGDQKDHFVLGDGSELPFGDDSFDVVCAFDTLEHVPKERREAFVLECHRVARSYAILAGPYDSPKVRHAEVLLRRFLKEKLGQQHRYLEEHRQNGLPKRHEVEGLLRDAGAKVGAVGHANLERWFGLMCIEFYLDDDPGLRRMAESVYEFYNRTLYASDHKEPVYRHAVVAAIGKAALPSFEDIFPEAAAPAGALEGLNEMLKSLIAFDVERGRWRQERAAFEQALADLGADLEGHRGSLETHQRDVEGNRKKAETLEHDLAHHKQALATVEKDLSHHRAKLATVEADLEQHRDLAAKLRARVEELEADREKLDGLREAAERRAAEHQAEAAWNAERHEEELLARQAIEENLRQHREVIREVTARRDEALAKIEELEQLLAEHKQVVEEVKPEVERVNADRDKLRVQIGELRAEHDKLQNLLADERQQSSDLVAKLRAQIAEQSEDSSTWKRDAQSAKAAHEEAMAEIEKYREGTGGFERELERLRAEAAELEARRHATSVQRDELRTRVEQLEEQLLSQGARYRELDRQGTDISQLEREWDQERAAYNESMADVLRDLDGHKEVLVQTKKERDDALSVIQTLEKDLDGHRRVLEKVMSERDALQASRDECMEIIKRLEATRPISGISDATAREESA